MGQAKCRGSREERIAKAQEKQKSQEPINVPCQTCGALLNGFTLVDCQSAGALWRKVCECSAITHAMVQSENLMAPVSRTFKTSLKHADAIAGPKKGVVPRRGKVRTAFIQKNLDSIETGIVRF